MTSSKEEERKALAKIKVIVEALGEGSYIGTAFTGAFQIAEDNIENDFGASTQEYVDGFYRKTMEIQEKDDQLAKKDEKIKQMGVELQQEKDNTKSAYETANNYSDKWRAECNRADMAEAKIKDMAMEVITLKAKLYDLLIKTAA